MTTPNMNLDLPVPEVDTGPGWATKLNLALEAVDEHDHSSGSGVKINVAGLNINTDFPINDNSLTEVLSIEFTSQASSLTTTNGLYSVNGELYWSDGVGTAVQLTLDGAINIASLGTIGGDFGSPGVNAAVTYSDLSDTFSFTQEAGVTAKMYQGSTTIVNETALSNGVTLKANATVATPYDFIFPDDAQGADTVLAFNAGGQGSFRTIDGTPGEVSVAKTTLSYTIGLASTISKDIAFTGNLSGRGILPVGAIIAMNTNLTGVTAVTATTSADANGLVTCSGQVISDATSPLNGQTIPNLNDSYFLMGATSSGTVGGSNTTTLTSTQLPAHTHTIDHGHSNTFALGSATVGSSSHTHTMAHVHQVGYSSTGTGFVYAQGSRSGATLSFTTGATSYLDSFGMDSGGSNAVAINSTGALYSAGATDDSGTAAASGTPSATTTVTLSGSVTSMTGSSGSSGTGSAYDSRPKYYTCKFVMRIK